LRLKSARYFPNALPRFVDIFALVFLNMPTAVNKDISIYVLKFLNHLRTRQIVILLQTDEGIRNNAVGVLTWLLAGRYGFRFPSRTRDFIFSETSKPGKPSLLFN